MSRRTAANLALSLVGLTLLVWQIDRVGPGQVVDGLQRVGLGVFPILALGFARFWLRSSAWLALLGQPAPLRTVVAATISGDALGNLTPLGLVASEPAKAAYLGDRVPAGHAFAALTAENFFYSVSVAAYVIVGAAALLAAFDYLPAEVRVAGIAALVAMALALLAAGWVAWQQPAAASVALSRLPSRRLSAVVARVREFEVRTYGSAGRKSARLGVVALNEAAFHVLSFAESWLTLYLVTGQSRPFEAFILDSVNRAINVVFKLVPMRVGVDEVGTEAVALAIGLAPGVGLLAALVRRVRMLVWSGVGLAMWNLRRPDTAAPPPA